MTTDTVQPTITCEDEGYGCDWNETFGDGLTCDECSATRDPHCLQGCGERHPKGNCSDHVDVEAIVAERHAASDRDAKFAQERRLRQWQSLGN